MSNYLLFYGDNFYPSCGWHDFRGSFESIDAARTHLKTQCGESHSLRPPFEWYQIVNINTKKIAVLGWFDPGLKGFKERHSFDHFDTSDIFGESKKWYRLFVTHPKIGLGSCHDDLQEAFQEVGEITISFNFATITWDVIDREGFVVASSDISKEFGWKV